jgi:transposase
MKAISEFDGIYLHRDFVDMRKGILGLSALVSAEAMGNLMGKNLFVFCGKRRKSIKILYFDKSGFALWQKALEEEKFCWPKKVNVETVIFTPQQLEWLLNGFDVLKMRPFAELEYEKIC